MAIFLQTFWNPFIIWSLLYFDQKLIELIAKDPIKDMPPLGQDIVWCRSDAKPSSEPTMNYQVNWHWASMNYIKL